MNIYTSENEMLKEELKAANAWIKASEKIIAEQDAKLKLALYRAVKTYHEGKPVYVAQQEPLEYWNAVEGWVKIDEVREHFDSVGCGTIYKTAGEGRVPLCVAQRKPLTDEEMFKIWLTVPAETKDRFAFARAIEAAHGIGDNT